MLELETLHSSFFSICAQSFMRLLCTVLTLVKLAKFCSELSILLQVSVVIEVEAHELIISEK